LQFEDDIFMVVIMEDGSSLKSAKAFTYNLSEKIQMNTKSEKSNVR